MADEQNDIDWWCDQNGWTKPSEREHLDRPDWAYDEDGYCVSCFNGKWKSHSPYCELAELYALSVGTDSSVSESLPNS